MPLVRRIAYHLLGRLPSSVQVDDLIQAGLIGLIEATRKFRPGEGASFETYAGIRIRGAILDEVRRCGWAPRSVHRRLREAATAMREIENEHKRDARDTEVAERMGISLREYHQFLADASGHRLTSLDELATGADTIADGLYEGIRGPVDELEAAELEDALAQAILGLPERERLVMALYYDEGLNLREIGSVLKVSESRVCQIHGQAVVRLRARLAGLGLASETSVEPRRRANATSRANATI